MSSIDDVNTALTRVGDRSLPKHAARILTRLFRPRDALRTCVFRSSRLVGRHVGAYAERLHGHLGGVGRMKEIPLHPSGLPMALSVGEVARRSGVAVSTVHFYEAQG